MSLTPEVHLTLSQRKDPVYPVGTHLPGPSSARTPRPHRGPRHGHLHVCVLRTFTPRQGQHGPAPQHALISRRFRGSTGLGFGSGCRDMGRGPRGGDDGRMPPKQMVGKPHAQAPLSQDLPLWPPQVPGARGVLDLLSQRPGIWRRRWIPRTRLDGGLAHPSLCQQLQRPQSSPRSVPWGPSWSPRGPPTPGHSSLGISPSTTSPAASGPCSPGLPAKAFLSHCCHSLSLHFGELYKVICKTFKQILSRYPLLSLP